MEYDAAMRIYRFTAACTTWMNFTNNAELKKPDMKETHCMIPFKV